MKNTGTLRVNRCKQMHLYISVHNSFSLQHNMELKINIVIQGVLHFLITNFVATEILVMGLSNNYSLNIANLFKHGELNNRGTSLVL